MTIGRAIAEHATRTPDASAIVAPGRAPLSYGRLAAQLAQVGAALRAAKIGRRDRVALVMSTGPEMALAFLGIVDAAVCAPLNPTYGSQEYQEYLAALRVKAVMVQEGDDTAAVVAAAEQLHLTIIRLLPSRNAAAGLFGLDVDSPLHMPADDSSHPDDLALVLLTSATTGRAKVVPLTHRNLYASAQFSIRAHRLDPSDRCLNVAPLFHMHGLCMVLSSVAAGASIVCPRSLEARSVFAHLDACRPTWYVAGPTMHREILAVAGAHQDIIARCRLRLIRSSAATLSAATLHDLERTFAAPVIESYGLTETGGLVARNPLPPGIRKPGSVGVAAGPDIAILGDGGQPRPAGQEGEIVVRGATVMDGYEGNETANAEAFIDGWFRTGDLGYLDHEGYLFITGRIKEFINRGGQKVSPYEVEAALLDHPSVAEAAVFAMPHPTLGEDVAAAVVLHPSATVRVAQLRTHVAEQVASFKVPRRIITVERLPRSATGKLQRLGLADTLGLVPSLDRDPPIDLPAASSLEAQLVTIWEDLLGVAPIGLQDDFFDLGGHSLLAIRLMQRIQETLGHDLPVSVLYRDGSIEHLAATLRTHSPSVPWSSLVAIQPHGSKPPFFCVHALFGDVGCYTELARQLGADQPVYGLQAQGLDGTIAPLTRIEAMAARYIEELRTIQSTGPYYLGGFSGGGTVAFEMAQQLQARGENVRLLAMFDHPCPGSGYEAVTWSPALAHRMVRNVVSNVPYWLATFLRSGRIRRVELLRQRLRLTAGVLNVLAAGRGTVANPSGLDLDAVFRNTPGLEEVAHWPEHRFAVIRGIHRAVREYRPAAYHGRITLFRARRQPILCSHQAALGWESIAEEGVELHVTPGSHHSMLYEPYVRVLARKLAPYFD